MINIFETSFEARERRFQIEKLYHGETVDLVGVVTTNGVPQNITGYAVSGVFQPTSAQGSDDFYDLSADIVDNKVIVHWEKGKDFGENSYMVWALLTDGENASYPIVWRLDMAYSPNFPLSSLAPIPKAIDFSKYDLLNAPWLELSAFDEFVDGLSNEYLPLSGGVVSGDFEVKDFLKGANRSLVIGKNNVQQYSDRGVALGTNLSTNVAAVAIGDNTRAGNSSIAIGQSSEAGDGSGIVIGNNSKTYSNSIAIGAQTSANYSQSIAIGNEASTTKTYEVRLGGPYQSQFGQPSLYVHDIPILSGSDHRIPKERLPYLSGYAKKEDIPEVPTDLSAFTNSPGYLTAHQSLSDYYTKEEADGKFLTAHQDLTDYATKEFVQSEISDFITEDALTGLATKEEVQAVDDKLSDYAEKEELTAYAQLSDVPELPEDIVHKDDLSVYAQLSDLENIDVGEMSACLSSTEFTSESYLSTGPFGELDVNSISLADIGNKINKILQLLKRDSSGPSGGDPTKTYVKYLDGTISELNIVGELGENSVPNKGNAINVQIGNTVTSIGSKAFFQCTNLETIDIPNTVTSFGGGAWYISPFYGCSKLKTFSIPNGVTTITNYMLGNCSSLMIDLTIPSSVTSIGTGAFAGCPATFVFDGKTMAEVQAMRCYSWDIPTGQGRIICTDGTL